MWFVGQNVDRLPCFKVVRHVACSSLLQEKLSAMPRASYFFAPIGYTSWQSGMNVDGTRVNVNGVARARLPWFETGG